MQLLEQYFKLGSDPKEQKSWEANWRNQSWERLVELGLPQSLKSIQFPEPAALSQKMDKTTDSHSLLFIDGFFQDANLTNPIVCMKLEEAILPYGIFLQNRLMRNLKEDFLAALNGAFQRKGAFLYIPPNIKVNVPLEICYRNVSQKMASPRLQVFLGKNASLRMIQRFSNESDAFTNVYLDINLDEGATLFLGDIQTKITQSIHFESIRSTLKKGSQLTYLSISNGAKLSHTSIKAQFLEENAEVKLLGLTQLSNSLQNHIDSSIEHVAPHTFSRQHFKAILRDQSQSCFEGKIIVRPSAVHTEAYQLNNHLLLSSEALSVAKPNLEIFADDVKASHGATVSQLNEEELFYFRSRGISLEIAQEMLLLGFCSEILNAAPFQIDL